MKFKTTQKQIKNNFGKVFAVGYCDLCNLLRFEKPIAYTCGVYGWNADIYEFGGIALVTGYRPFGKNIPFDLVQEYDKQAREIINGKSGAEYLSTTFVECPTGHREGTFEGVFARVDGGELKIFTKRLEALGIKLVINSQR